jgi:hypothetical protein
MLLPMLLLLLLLPLFPTHITCTPLSVSLNEIQLEFLSLSLSWITKKHFFPFIFMPSPFV